MDKQPRSLFMDACALSLERVLLAQFDRASSEGDPTFTVVLSPVEARKLAFDILTAKASE